MTMPARLTGSYEEALILYLAIEGGEFHETLEVSSKKVIREHSGA